MSQDDMHKRPEAAQPQAQETAPQPTPQSEVTPPPSRAITEEEMFARGFLAHHDAQAVLILYVADGQAQWCSAAASSFTDTMLAQLGEACRQAINEGRPNVLQLATSLAALHKVARKEAKK